MTGYSSTVNDLVFLLLRYVPNKPTNGSILMITILTFMFPLFEELNRRIKNVPDIRKLLKGFRNKFSQILILLKK